MVAGVSKDQLVECIRALGEENVHLKHVIIAMGGVACTCDRCAPTAAAKAEREAINDCTRTVL